jgi:hypothetical protein
MSLHNCGDIIVKNNIMNVVVLPNSIFTLTGYADPSHADTSDSKPDIIPAKSSNDANK